MGHAPADGPGAAPLPGRVISCLEGGYVLSPLARSAAAHVKVLIGAD
jgi:acetoin utilization deacetylase AcuC-like enzyme